MKKMIILILASYCTLYAQTNVEILSNYEDSAEKVISFVKNNQIAEAKTENLLLADHGIKVMNSYLAKKQECKDQYKVFIEKIPSMYNLTVKELHSLYHDGNGIPRASRSCYLGRAQVIHPVMNQVRLQGEVSETIKNEIIEETEEVIEHLEMIKKVIL